MPDVRWWHQVFVALPKGYDVAEFNTNAQAGSSVLSSSTALHLRLVIHGVNVHVYEWRLNQIAKRHTKPKPAAAALVRAFRRAEKSLRAWGARPAGPTAVGASGFVFEPNTGFAFEPDPAAGPL